MEIINAYHQWHMECIHHLYNEFSFVIYDPITQIHFAARDALGTRPLYYTVKNGRFYYSDDIGDVFHQSQVEGEPNIDALQTLMHHRTIPYDETMYKYIKRLPPGHTMVVDKDGNSKIERYWKPEEIKVDEDISEEDATKRFLELFQKVIEDRIDDIVFTSFELSGGLDSSSIVSMAKKIYSKEKIKCVSMNFEGMEKCDESEYIDAMKDLDDLDITKILITGLDYQNQYSLEYNYQLNPHWPILLTFTMGFPVAEKLKEMGIKRVLTGQGGDHILSGNRYLMYDNFKNLQWIELYRELKASRKPMKFLKQYIIGPLLSDKQKRLIRSVLQYLYIKKKDRDENSPLVDKKFQEFSDQFSKDSLAFWYDLDVITSSLQSLTVDNSYYHVAKKHYGIEFYHPFYDRRLVEFMLSLPARFKYRDSTAKVLLRKAMKGILPEKIRQRRDKAEFSAVIKQQIDAIELDELLSDTYLVKLGLIEQIEIDQLKEDYISGKMKSVVYFWKIINMEYWYRYNFVMNHEED